MNEKKLKRTVVFRYVNYFQQIEIYFVFPRIYTIIKQKNVLYMERRVIVKESFSVVRVNLFCTLSFFYGLIIFNT